MKEVLLSVTLKVHGWDPALVLKLCCTLDQHEPFESSLYLEHYIYATTCSASTPIPYTGETNRMLTFKIRTPEVPAPSTEDIYSNAVGLLFPDNLRTFHGDPGSHITYVSKRFGDMPLRLADPRDQEERVLFAHHIWNAGIQMAEFISDARDPTVKQKEGAESVDGSWDVTGHSVLELGSGAWRK